MVTADDATIMSTLICAEMSELSVFFALNVYTVVYHNRPRTTLMLHCITRSVIYFVRGGALYEICGRSQNLAIMGFRLLL